MTVKKDDLTKKITSNHLDADRLAAGGGDKWTIMEDGSVDGIDYEYKVVKVLSFTSQPTKKNPERFFNFATVMCDEGTILNLPINTGLITTYYQEFLDEENNLIDDHSCNMTVEYNVKTFEDEKGKAIKDGAYLKKQVSNIVYSA